MPELLSYEVFALIAWHYGSQGVLVTLAIGLHNIPEGLAVATSLVARGVGARQALIW